MIKAEIISHEGNPGANWLDRCRSLITPKTVTTLIIVVGIAGIIIGVQQKSDSNSRTAANANVSQPATPSSPLSVQSPQSASYQTNDGASPSLQSAAGASASVGTANNGTVTNGTSQLNATSTTPDAAQQSNYNQQSGLTNKSLTNLKGVQSSIPAINTVTGTLQNFSQQLGL